MKISISPGDLVVAKNDFSLYENEHEPSESFLVKKGSAALVIAVKSYENDAKYVCMYLLRLKSGQVGWTFHLRSDVKDTYSVLATT